MQNVNEYLRENLNKVGGNIYIAPNIPEKKINNEPPRDCRRLNFLREYDNENTKLYP